MIVTTIIINQPTVKNTPAKLPTSTGCSAPSVAAQPTIIRQIKTNHALKFLEKGYKVQFTMLFRGREMMHVDHGYQIMEEILEAFQEYAKIERPAKMAGRRMTMVITPLK